jgi:hypothetical protein
VLRTWTTTARCLAASAVLTVAGAGCSTGSHAASGADPPGTPSTSTAGPLRAPDASTTQDSQFFEDLAQADPALATYVNAYSNVALKALLTDGSAFCAFLNRGGGIDNAMEDVVIGARSVESQTNLPSTVTTFNSIDAVALIALCPSEQKLIPAADQAHLQSLEKSLGSQ